MELLSNLWMKVKRKMNEFLVLLGLGYFFGRYLERKHYKSIFQREKKFSSIPALTIKTLPEECDVVSSKVCCGSVVVSVDYFKRFIASIINIFGGEMKSYSSLIDRARREAIPRMKQEAPRADFYMNMKIDTSSISKGSKNNLGAVEVLCYATAIKLKSSS